MEHKSKIMRNSKQKEESAGACHMSMRISADMRDAIDKIAVQQNMSRSDVVRELLHAGMAAKGYEQDEDHLYQLVRQAVKNELKAPVERLAAISAKAAQAAGANFFINVFSAALRLPERERSQILEAVSIAREQGIQFLKVKDDGMDELLKRGAENMLGEDEST